MNEINDYEEERQVCFKRWNDYGLLNGIENEDLKKDLAVILENQRLKNNEANSISQFERLSIPIIVRIFRMLKLPYLISIQPLLVNTKSTIFFFENNKIVKERIDLKAYKTRTRWDYGSIDDLRSVWDINAEDEFVYIISQELTSEIEHKVFSEIIESASLKKEIDFNQIQGETLNEKCGTIQNIIINLAIENQEFYHRPFPNWIIAAPEVCEIICSRSGPLGMHMPWGNISTDRGDMQVWCNPLFQTGKVIIGYKGKHPYDAGYVYAPYIIMLGLTPTVLDPNSFIPIKYIQSKYGCKLVDPTYYSTLTIKNLQIKGN